MGGAAPPRRHAPIQGAWEHALQADFDAQWGGRLLPSDALVFASFSYFGVALVLSPACYASLSLFSVLLGLSAVRRCTGCFPFALADLYVINCPYTPTSAQ